MQKDPRRCQDLICRASAIQPDVISDPCTLYGARRCVIGLRSALSDCVSTIVHSRWRKVFLEVNGVAA
jgi:hypothetical protein